MKAVKNVRKNTLRWLLLALLLALLPVAVYAQDEVTDDEVNDVAKDIYCPVCESTPLDECIRIMEESQIRRVPVVNGGGMCCGIVAQADIAKHAPRRATAELVSNVSQPAVSH